MDQSFYTWGLPFGQIRGIRIRLHWLLLGYWVYLLNDLLQAGVRGGRLFVFWGLGIGVVLLVVLLHELGHCYAARRVGGDAEEVLLWPLGGLAFVHAPRQWRAQLTVALGGPLVNVAIAGVCFGVLLLLGKPLFSPGPGESPYIWIPRAILLEFNLVILLFNLIPLYPLDGGRVFQSLAWGYLLQRGRPGGAAYANSLLATLWASRVTAVLGIGYALYKGSLLLGIIFLWAWWNAEQLRRLMYEQEQGGFLGYDFSRGYTSLEAGSAHGSSGSKRKASFLSRLAAKRKQRSLQKAIEDERRLDELLAKISREGMASLSPGERAQLERLSRR
jgi:Zn-dependent protease